MLYPELPLLAFLSVLVLFPTAYHLKTQNFAIVTLLCWLLLANIINGVNVIIWAGNTRNPISIWCDITTKVLLGASYGVPLSMLCVCKHLAMLSSSRKMLLGAKENKHRAIFEGIMCLGLPLTFMILHYIVQGHRYDIFENIGCQAAVYISAPAILIIWFPPLLFSAITLIYTFFALFHFVRRRLTFAAHLQHTGSGLTTNRYLRLLTLALIESVWIIAVTSYSLSKRINSGLRPWTSWAAVHTHFSAAAVFRTQDLPRELFRCLLLSWWSLPVSSLILFVCFGFGEEAVNDYRKMWKWFSSTILRRSVTNKPKTSFGIDSCRRPRLKSLHLVHINTASSSSLSKADSLSHDRGVKSPPLLVSHPSSASTIPPIAHHDSKKAEWLRSQEVPQSQYIPEPSPSYRPSETIYQQSIAIPIVSRRISPPLPPIAMVSKNSSLPDLEGSDTSTLSTFSYHGGAIPSAIEDPLRSPALSMLAPEPPLEIEPVSLPPPPRRRPRHMGSNRSVNSAPTIVPGVPEDVGSASFEQRGVLGVSGGGIFITVEREEHV